MGIRAEESIWFQVSYIGSRGALGTLPDGALDVRRIDTGRTLAEHIAECGGDPDALRAGSRFLDPARLAAYLELHIEQAPSLVEAGRTGGDLHRHPRQLPLSRRAHRGQPRPCRPAAPLPPRRGAGGCRIRHGARPPVGGTRREGRADGLHDRPLPHRSGVARPDHRARRVPFQPRRARLRRGRAGRTRPPGGRHHRRHRAAPRRALPPRDEGARGGRVRSIRRSGPRWNIALPSSAFRCCSSAVLPRTTPLPSPPPACRWA